MLNYCLFDILDFILPSSDRSKHDTLRLEYLSACQVMENEIYFMKILNHIPVPLFKPLLKSLIYKCYLEFINIDEISCISVHEFCSNLVEREIVFPDTLRILVLNWPHTELVLKNNIPPLHPPVEIFQNVNVSGESPNEAICEVDDMLTVFYKFCNRLVLFIIQAVFKCTPRNIIGFSCNLKRLDVSGFSGLGSLSYSTTQEDSRSFSSLCDNLKEINNSTINHFGHKIEIFADGEIDLTNVEFEHLRYIVEENMNPNARISIYFTRMSTVLFNSQFNYQLSDFYSVLAQGRCKYISITEYQDNDECTGKDIYTYLPELVSISIQFPGFIKSLDFLSTFEYLEEAKLQNIGRIGLIYSISNMSKGLKFLDISCNFLHSKDLENLANSIHSDTLLELDLTFNEIADDPEAFGLITLCQMLKNARVLKIEDCTLDQLSSNTISKLVNALKDCAQLEFLAMRGNQFSLDITHIIIDGLAHKKSLRYLSLNLPEPDNMNIEIQRELCKTFHETINNCRYSPIYISWDLNEWHY